MSEEPKEENKGLISWFISLFTGEEKGEGKEEDVVIVDEAQDLTKLQWDMCQKIWKNAKRVYISGDDDQAIFRWAGADVDSFIAQDGKFIRKIMNKK